MFFGRSKSKLGVDIGTSSIKIVQLGKEPDHFTLESYGIVNVSTQAPDLDTDVIVETAQILKQLVSRSGATTKKAVVSLPNNVVFISVIEMPSLSEKELKQAIEWEARRYVPMPLEDVTLSWSVLSEPRDQGKLQVLLTAVPTSVIENYLKMFRLAGLEPQALEIEALALIRSLVGNRKDSFLIIDIGSRNTSLNLVDKGFLRLSRNLTVGGETITAGIAQSLRVSFNRAEQFKRDLGLSGGMQQIPETVRPAIDSIKNETNQLIKIYESGGNVISEIILAGGGAAVPGLLNYFSDLGIKVSLGDPLKFISFNPKLKESLESVSLSLSIAFGLAMRE